MNPSPFGAFAEGLAGGTNQALQIYMMKTMKKLEVEQKRDDQNNIIDLQIVLNPHTPPAMKTKHNNAMNERRKKYDPNHKGFIVEDDAWGGQDMVKALANLKKIIGDKTTSSGQKEEAYQAWKKDVIVNPMIEATRGKSLIETEEARRKEAAYKTGVTGLAEGGFTPDVAGQLSGAGAPGRDIIKQHTKPEKTPATPMHIDVHIGKDQHQKMRYNSKTGQHDIPVGKPYTKRAAGSQPVFRSSGADVYEMKPGKGGKTEAKLLVKGSVRHYAVGTAMKTIDWSLLTEVQQMKRVDRHEQLHLGKTGKRAKLKPTKAELQDIFNRAEGDEERALKILREMGFAE